jgi:para-nitrobenzyl esterase
MDGGVLPQYPFDPGAPEISADVPLLTGSNLHEFVNGLDRPEAQAMQMDELHRLASQEFGERSNEIIGAYRRDYPRATPFDLYATIAASSVRRPVWEQASRKAALGRAPAYSYIYAWRTPVLNGRPGAFHAAELAFTFDNAELCDHYSGGSTEAIALSKKISTAWVSFARTGNPNHDGLPHWPTYTSERRATMQFDRQCEVRNNPESLGLRLIAESPEQWQSAKRMFTGSQLRD